ncbi:hypothetical protein [Ruania albidiflava]|uniref:hypothetical protein n=1 Tax=Ruania albidiflava TaxID=366586 RepID=UPI0003FBF0FF|nr:hypothetical protein [Ruania albidiflava]
MSDQAWVRSRDSARKAEAQKDSRWERAYAGPATAVVPDDRAVAIATPTGMLARGDLLRAAAPTGALSPSRRRPAVRC